MAANSTKLNDVDIIICAIYLVSVIIVGMGVTYAVEKLRQRAQHRRELEGHAEDHDILADFFLGGKTLPWWALGIADVSSYIDISGTMINAALLYALGTNGFYIEIRGGICLMLAFQIAYTGKLARRSETMTKGEWMEFRFGSSRQARAARLTLVALTLLSGIATVSYFAEGGGKLVAEFLKIPSWLGYPSELWCALFLMLMALSYTIVSGFTSLVYTDVYQSVFVVAAFLYITGMAMGVTLPESFVVYHPMRADSSVNITSSSSLSLVNSFPAQNISVFNASLLLTTGSSLLPAYAATIGFFTNTTEAQPVQSERFLPVHVQRDSWMSVFPKANLNIDSASAYSQYNLFQLAVGFYLLRTSIASAGGPKGGGLQTILAQKTDRDVGLQTLTALLWLMFRWGFIASMAILAIDYTTSNPGQPIDPENIIGVVLEHVIPHGGRGFVLAALLAAGMTTFDTALSSNASYWTVDIYKTFVNPQASDKQLLWQARLAGVVIIVLGLFVSLYVRSINQIWGFMTMTLGTAEFCPSFLSWYWSRMNGYGYCAGVAGGVAASILHLIISPNGTEYTAFLFVAAASLLSSIVTSLYTEEISSRVTSKFYKKTRPPGLWKHVQERCLSYQDCKELNYENKMDLLSAAVAVVWQMSLYLLTITFVMRSWEQFLFLLLFVAVISYLHYRLWYCRMDLHWSPSSLLSERGRDGREVDEVLFDPYATASPSESSSRQKPAFPYYQPTHL